MGDAVRWWISYPQGHRRIEVAGSVDPTLSARFGERVTIISAVDPGAEWVCDFCSDPIPLVTKRDDGSEVELFVPVLDGNALCPKCVAKHADPKLVKQAKAKKTPSLGAWSLEVCACAACVGRMDQIIAESISSNANS